MIRSLPTIVAALVLVLIVGGAPSYVASQGEDVLAQARAWPHGEALELPGAHETVAEFTLPADHTRPVYLYLQAILRYRALSHSAGVLRFAVNDAPLGPEHSVNKAAEWCPAPQGPYAARAFALPAQPGFDAGAREDLGGLGYLFDITDLARPGANTLRITHVAATDAALLRDAALIVGGERVPLTLSAARVETNDPALLEWNFAPNIMEGRGLFLAQGCLQALDFRVRNRDDAGAVQLGFELELPVGVRISAPWLPYGAGWSAPITLQSEERGPIVSHAISFPPEAAVGPETDWGTFTGHPLLLYLRCEAAPGEYELRWRSLSQGGPGEWMTAPLTVLTAPPETPQPARSPLGVWAYRTVQPGVTETEQATQAMLRGEVCAQLQRLGVSRLVLSDADDIASARAYGLLVSLASPWSFDRTVYPSSTTDPERALIRADGEPVLADPRTGEMQWCPTYAAEHGPEVFGPITERIATEGWDGFDLDHEGVHHQCFCDRCHAAFLARAGLAEAEVAWPADVLPEGRLHERWLDFHVWNGGRHVERLREAVKAGDPDALLFSWFTMSLYEREAEGYEDRVREEREYGYDLREFMRYFDFANMANGVYPHDEATWEDPYGLTWAFNRVEATVDNPWDVPLAPCLNIGSGAERSWTHPDYLRWQAKTHLAQGVNGLDFWMLPFFDGRHFTLLSELGRILAATEDVVRDGVRVEGRIRVTAPEGIFARAFATDTRLVLGLTNRTLEPVTVELAPGAGVVNGRQVLSGERVGGRVIVPTLDGVFVEYDLR